MHQIITRIEKLQELTPTSTKKEPFTQPYAPRKICQLSSKERKLQKSNHAYK
jgi:hypothetical protein